MPTSPIILGTGAYGTIYKPPLPCANGSPTKSNTVGKVFEKDGVEDMLIEKYHHEFINKIDPPHKYTLPLYKECILVKNEQHQLIYKYGGKDLKNLLRTKGTFKKFIKFIKNIKPLLEGLKVLKDHKYVHQDIKPENILINKNKIYLIDFGLSRKFNEIYINTNDYVLNHVYPYFPPEYSLKNYNNSFDQFYKKYKKSIDFNTQIYNKRINFLNSMKTELNINIKEELENIYKKPSYDPSKIDVFSFGIVILIFYLWSGIGDLKIKSPSSKIVSFKNKIINFINGLINLDVKKRYSIEQAIEEYKNLID
jgi:serine/threonine protein kinase